VPESVPRFSGRPIRFTPSYPGEKGRGVRTPFLRFATALGAKKGAICRSDAEVGGLIGVTHTVIDEMFATQANRKEEDQLISTFFTFTKTN